MGSDNAPESLLAALVSLAPLLKETAEIIAIGAPEFAPEANRNGLSFLPAQETIAMDENPLFALRKKKEASLCVGLRSLKEGRLDAFVSGGNTGALVSGAKIILGTFPGIPRPALLALIPTKKQPVAILDVGANVEAKAAHLIQFAKLGAAYQKARGIAHPRIGILNIGSEASKGTPKTRLAYKELQKTASFAGNIEGKSVFDGDVDVLITDGFTGNVFLKTAEGIASLILDRLQSHSTDESIQQMRPHFEDLQKHLHYTKHPGALLCGVKKTVVKCHGYSTLEAFVNAVRGAADLEAKNFVEKFTEFFLSSESARRSPGKRTPFPLP